MTHVSGYLALALCAGLLTAAAPRAGATDPATGQLAQNAGSAVTAARSDGDTVRSAPDQNRRVPARTNARASAVAAGNPDIHLLNSWRTDGEPYHTWRGLERQ